MKHTVIQITAFDDIERHATIESMNYPSFWLEQCSRFEKEKEREHIRFDAQCSARPDTTVTIRMGVVILVPSQ